jgi:hypothetical protein
MRRWSFWDGIAYLVFLVVALILAADSGVRIAPELAAALPHWVQSPYVGLAPLALMLLATVIWIANFAGVFTFLGPRHPIKLFLERDSSSNLLGIQTFPAINYIQPSVTTTRRMEKCSAWIAKVEYDVGGSTFAKEFGERWPLPWSKAIGNNLEVDLEPHHPPIRLNVAVFTDAELALDPATPTNLKPLLQRNGIHRFTIFVSGVRADGKRLNEIFILEIEWFGPGQGAIVKTLKRT